jgi:hypothetical protein
MDYYRYQQSNPTVDYGEVWIETRDPKVPQNAQRPYVGSYSGASWRKENAQVGQEQEESQSSRYRHEVKQNPAYRLRDSTGTEAIHDSLKALRPHKNETVLELNILEFGVFLFPFLFQRCRQAFDSDGALSVHNLLMAHYSCRIEGKHLHSLRLPKA